MMKKMVVSVLSAVVFSGMAADVSDTAKMLLEKATPGTITYADPSGWLYSRSELGHLAKGALAGGEIIRKSACRKAKNADPLPALKAFNDELKVLGIQLIVVPVPPKAAVCPPAGMKPGEAMVYLTPYYEELRKAGIEILDLSSDFRECPVPAYCKTDAHWSPAGIALAVRKLGSRIPIRGNAHFDVKIVKQLVAGDLSRSLSPDSPEKEELSMSVVSGKIIDENSPVLLIGDSHTLVFSTGGDMLAENAGFAEALAKELTMPVDRIGVKGSAATSVRINLYRKAAKNPAWLKNKKFIIYCFSCREFTENTSGWGKVPVLKK